MKKQKQLICVSSKANLMRWEKAFKVHLRQLNHRMGIVLLLLSARYDKIKTKKPQQNKKTHNKENIIIPTKQTHLSPVSRVTLQSSGEPCSRYVWQHRACWGALSPGSQADPPAPSWHCSTSALWDYPAATTKRRDAVLLLQFRNLPNPRAVKYAASAVVLQKIYFLHIGVMPPTLLAAF